jgi:hypothetical protein
MLAKVPHAFCCHLHACNSIVWDMLVTSWHRWHAPLSLAQQTSYQLIHAAFRMVVTASPATRCSASQRAELSVTQRSVPGSFADAVTSTHLALHDKGAAIHCRLTSTKSGSTSASREHSALARLCQCSPTTASCQDHSSSRPRAHTKSHLPCTCLIVYERPLLQHDGDTARVHQLILHSLRLVGAPLPLLCACARSRLPTDSFEMLSQGSPARDALHTQLFAGLEVLPAGRPRQRRLRRCVALCLQCTIATSTARNTLSASPDCSAVQRLCSALHVHRFHA